MGPEAIVLASYEPPTPSAPYSQIFCNHKSFKGDRKSFLRSFRMRHMNSK